MAKNFFDVFRRYEPTPDKRKILSEGTLPCDPRAVDAERLCWEIDIDFSNHVDAEILYEIADECCATYGMKSVRILPHFAPEEFSLDYCPEIYAEAALCGAVTMGFFRGAEVTDDGETLTVAIPFDETGVAFVRTADTERLLSGILYNRYRLKRNFVIRRGAHTEA